jgi:alanine transaminase
LDEDNNWGMRIDELERAYQAALDRCEPKAICIINPGNPTGQVLSLENIQAIIKWAYEKKLFILADEVKFFKLIFVNYFLLIIFFCLLT